MPEGSLIIHFNVYTDIAYIFGLIMNRICILEKLQVIVKNLIATHL